MVKLVYSFSRSRHVFAAYGTLIDSLAVLVESYLECVLGLFTLLGASIDLAGIPVEITVLCPLVGDKLVLVLGFAAGCKCNNCQHKNEEHGKNSLHIRSSKFIFLKKQSLL